MLKSRKKLYFLKFDMLLIKLLLEDRFLRELVKISQKKSCLLFVGETPFFSNLNINLSLSIANNQRSYGVKTIVTLFLSQTRAVITEIYVYTHKN